MENTHGEKKNNPSHLPANHRLIIKTNSFVDDAMTMAQLSEGPVKIKSFIMFCENIRLGDKNNAEEVFFLNLCSCTEAKVLYCTCDATVN